MNQTKTWIKKKTNLHCTVLAGNTPKRVMSGGASFRGLSPGQHSSAEISRRWRAVGDTVFDLTGPEIEPQTSSTDSDALTN